jgi:flagellar basal-body rod modification protein FlgD
MTTPVTSPTSSTTPAAATTNADALSQLSNNFQTFLSLLTTQLKNQDPLSPMDSTQFTQQLVQMSGVQAQLTGNNLLQQVANNTGTGISTAVGLIGKQVKAVSDNAQLASGKADWAYNLPSDAASVSVEIVDSKGTMYHAETLSGDQLKAGDHAFSWNGKDRTGTNAPEGVYTLRLTALDASGATLASTNYVQGVVTSVEQSNGSTLIAVGPTKVDWSSVKSITQPSSSSSSTSTATGGS